MSQQSDPFVDLHAAATSEKSEAALPPPPDAPPVPPADKSPRKGKWAKRFRRLTILALLLVIASRFLGVLLLPTVLRKAANYYDLDCTYERLDLSALGGDAGLWHLALTPKSGGEPILQTEYCRGRVSLLDLLRGRLAVSRLEADGVQLNLDRDADGTIPLLQLLAKANTSANNSAAPVTVKPAAAPASASAIDLNPPIAVEALRLMHVQLHLRDKAAAPPLDATVMVNVRVSDFGSTARPAVVSVDMDADPFLDAMHFDAQVRGDGKSIDATLSGVVNGLRLRPLAAYLEPFGIRPIAETISLKANGHLKAAPSAKNPQQLAASFTADSVSALADNVEAAACDHLTLEADAIDTRTIKLGKIAVDGGRIVGRRAANGDIRFAGLEILPRAGNAAAPTPSAAPAANTAAVPLALPAISLEEFSVKNSRATFHDEGVTPAVELSFIAEDFTAKNIVLDPAVPDAAVELAGTFHAPGLVNSAHLSGSLTPFATKKLAKIQLAADGIAPAAVKPYLDLLGIESTLRAGTFTAGIDADATLAADGIDANAGFSNVRFADTADLIALDHVKLAGIGYHFNPAKITLKDIELAGPAISVQRDSSGAIAALGFRTRHAAAPFPTPSPATPTPPEIAATTVPSTAVASVKASAPAPAFSLPAIEVSHLIWKDIHFEYDDQAAAPPLHAALKDAGVELSNVLIDLHSKSPAPPGKIRAWASLPGVVDSFTVDGTLTPQPSAVTVDVQLAASGLTAATVAPYLKTIGIEPTLKAGTLSADALASVMAADHGIVATVEVKGARYADGASELAGVDRFRIDGAAISTTGVDVASIEIDRPRISITHEPDGAFATAGVRIHPDALTAPTHAAASPAHVPPLPISPKGAPAATGQPVPFNIAVKAFRLKDATIGWIDNAVASPVKTAAHATLSVDDLSLAAGTPPAAYTLAAAVDGVIDRAAVTGTITPSLAAASLVANVDASGIRSGPLTAYLPPAVRVSLKDGQFKTRVEAGANLAGADGMGIKLVVSDLDYRDRNDTAPLLAIGSVRAVASRIDLPTRLAIDELSTAGVETGAQRTADGGIALLGITFHPAAPADPSNTAARPASAPALSPAPPVAPANSPATTPATAPAPALPAVVEDVATLVAAAHKPPAYITLGKLDLNVKRLVVADLARPQSAPLTIADLHLRNAAPIELGGKDAESKPPVQVRMDCTLDPVVGAVALTAQLSPFAQQPGAVVDLTAGAIRGDGIIALVPELKPFIDGSALTDGQFHVHSDTQFKLVRRGPWGFDLSRGLGADVDVKDIAFRAKPGGPVLAGLDEIHSDGIRVAGDSSVHVKTLEINKPIGRVSRETDGIHVIGLVIKLPTTAPSASASPATTTVATASPAPAAPPAPTPPVAHAKPSSEIRIDQVLISDIDFQAADNVVSPPLVVPLNSLDVEVRNLSSLAPYEDKPVQFTVLVTAGKVRIPKHNAEAKAGESAFNERELFAQVAASGKIGLYPQPNGWVKTAVSGFELASLESEAKQFSINITRGVFDNTFDVHLPGDGSAQISTKLITTDMSLSEPPDGPIRRLLNLPAPLDVAIGLVQDADDSITIPLSVPVEKGKISTASIVGAGVGAMSSVLTTAITSAPMKAVQGVGGLLGFGGKKPGEEQPITITFSPGYTALDSPGDAALKQLAQRLGKQGDLDVTIRHELGSGDIARAAERANPSPGDAQALAYQLRQQRLDELEQRSQLAGQARSELSWGAGSTAAATLGKLRDVNRQIADTDEAIDHIYELLRPGADRQATRRTRGACIDYGRQRIAAVNAALLAAVPPDAKERIHTTNPQYTDNPHRPVGSRSDYAGDKKEGIVAKRPYDSVRVN